MIVAPHLGTVDECISSFVPCLIHDYPDLPVICTKDQAGLFPHPIPELDPFLPVFMPLWEPGVPVHPDQLSELMEALQVTVGAKHGDLIELRHSIHRNCPLYDFAHVPSEGEAAVDVIVTPDVPKGLMYELMGLGKSVAKTTSRFDWAIRGIRSARVAVTTGDGYELIAEGMGVPSYVIVRDPVADLEAVMTKLDGQ